jgi:hypothetical protein
MREPFFLRKAHKSFRSVPATTAVNDASHTLMEEENGFILVATEAGMVVIDSARIGKWLMTKAADGIVDLEGAAIAEVAAIGQPTPLVARRATLSELLAATSASGSRYAIITEAGKPSEKILGVVDLTVLNA